MEGFEGDPGRRSLLRIREIEGQYFADPQRFFVRIEEIVHSGHESFDLLELKDGRNLRAFL